MEKQTAHDSSDECSIHSGLSQPPSCCAALIVGNTSNDGCNTIDKTCYSQRGISSIGRATVLHTEG